jgi:hypothetical protein
MYWSWIRTRHQHYGRVGLEPDPERCKRYQLRRIHTVLLDQNAGITEQLLTHTSIHTPSIDNPIQTFLPGLPSIASIATFCFLNNLFSIHGLDLSVSVCVCH